MPAYFGLSVRLLARTFHGRRDGGAPEWPPIAAPRVSGLGRRRVYLVQNRPVAARATLDWLTAQPPPELIAPPDWSVRAIAVGTAQRHGSVAKAWCRRGTSDLAMPTRRPTAP